MALPKFGDYMASRSGVEVALPDEIAASFNSVETDSPAVIKDGDGAEIARATVLAGGAKALVFAPGIGTDDIVAVELTPPAEESGVDDEPAGAGSDD